MNMEANTVLSEGQGGEWEAPLPDQEANEKWLFFKISLPSQEQANC